MKIFFLLFQFLFLFHSFDCYALSSEKIRRDHVFVSLVSEYNQISNNENFYIGLNFLLDRDWHIYWKNPGDSGTAPKIEWILEDSVKASEIQWPPPQKIFLDPLTNYGYENEVLFPIIISVSDIKEKFIQVKAKVEWLVCKIECIPGQAELELNIPVGDTSIPSQFAQKLKSTVNSIPSSINSLNPTYSFANGFFNLNFSYDKNMESAYYFPNDGNSILHSSEQKLIKNKNSNQLIIPVSESLVDIPEEFSGVLKVTLAKENPKEKSKTYFYDLSPKKEFLVPEKKEFGLALIFAFLGGLILNLMPCVFPVISIKILSLIQLTKDEPKKIRTHAWFYTFGVLVSFLILSSFLLLLQSLGQNLGWGFQLQSPFFVLAMIYLFFFMGLNLFGVFELDGSFVNAGNSLAQKKGYSGTFFTGVLAVLVATPCTAPFMGAALGVTLTMPPALALLVYLSLGFGLAFPYLALCYFPSLVKQLPKPGLWMKSFKEFLSFPMFFTVLWLLWVLSFQAQSDSIILVLATFILILMMFWLNKVSKLNSKIKALAFILIIGLSILYVVKTLKVEASQSSNSIWKKFEPKLVEEHIKNKERVFIDFTAAWCLTCQVNKKVVLNTEEVLKYFNDKKVNLYAADWTNQDPIITETLKKLGRNSVPVYLYYDETGKEIILPELLSKNIIYESIK